MTCLVFILILAAQGAFAEDPDQLHYMLPSFVKKYPDRNRLEKVSDGHIEIYTKDSVEKVRAFYRKTRGREPDDKGRFCIVRLVGPGVDDNFWVKVQEKKARHRFFAEGLDTEIMIEQDQQAKAELQRLRDQYDYLASGWYPDYDPQAKMKSCLSSRRFNNDRRVKRSQTNQEDIARQIQQLVAQGRFQEAAALGRGGLAPSMKKEAEVMKEHQAEDKAAEWRACLKEVADHRYVTKVWIDMVEQEFYDRFRHEPCNR